jgi:Ca-activated chloride channel family protein
MVLCYPDFLTGFPDKEDMLRFIALLSFLAKPALACKLALILSMDVSTSIDSGEYGYQRDGLAEDLLDREVINVLVRDQVALMVVQWSGANDQAVVLAWRRMLSEAEVRNFSNRVRMMRREYVNSNTAVGSALAFSIAQFAAVQDCGRKVIDVSGDGASNSGAETSSQSRRAARQGIEINGVAIDIVGNAISEYYRRFVVTPQGFVLTATGFSDYPRTIRAKLLRELVLPGS